MDSRSSIKVELMNVQGESKMPFSAINALKSNAPRTTRPLVLSIAFLLLPTIALHASSGLAFRNCPQEATYLCFRLRAIRLSLATLYPDLSQIGELP
jgi:hypothetical protein